MPQIEARSGGQNSLCAYRRRQNLRVDTVEINRMRVLFEALLTGNACAALPKPELQRRYPGC